MTVSPGASFGYGSGTNDADLYNTGTFTFTGPGTLSDENGYWGLHNSGTVTVSSGTFELHSSGNTKSTFEDGGHISGAGTLKLDEPLQQFGTASSETDATFTGTTTIDAGGTLEYIAAYVDSGDPKNPGNPLTLDLKGGRLEGAGNIDAVVNNEGGTVAPGGSGAAGTLKITQTYTQASKAGIEIELGGNTTGKFDTLDVAGDATLDGTISVGLVGSFLPAVGDSYKVITSPNVTGNFADVTQSPNATVNVTYNPTDVVLGVTSVTPPMPGPDGGTNPDSGTNPGADGGGDAGTPPAGGGSGSGSGGCSIAVPGGAGSSFAALLALAGAALLLRRRRR